MGSDTEGESATVKKAESVAQPGRAIKIVVLVIILLPPIAAIIAGYSTLSIGNWFRLSCVMALAVFLPIMAYSYFFFRKQRREAEVKRIIDILDIPEDSDYFAIYKSINSGPYLFLACGLATTISLIGLGILFQGANIGVGDMELFVLDGHRFPKKNSMLILGMAFLGAYLWGLNYIFERYSRNDLSPGAFYTLSIRTIFASIIAVLIFNIFESQADGGEGGVFTDYMWPVVAFMVGTFPQRGMEMLTERIPMFSPKNNHTARDLPLAMIEGITSYDKNRLAELGVHSCHDLAEADFIPLMLKSSYGARQLTSWILQAKLCVYCGEAVKELRLQGIRDILDLEPKYVKGEVIFDIADLAMNSSATESNLKLAQHAAMTDPEIRRLHTVAKLLSQYTKTSDKESVQAASQKTESEYLAPE